MSSRPLRTGHARPAVPRPREKLARFPAVPRGPVGSPAAEARELWLGVHLPLLSLEALLPSFDVASRDTPRAIVEMNGQSQFIVSACEQTMRGGVRTGMSLAAALALVPSLSTLTRDLASEQRLLSLLATRANRFTPRVSLVPPDGLLLEVKGSLHLFGGVAALRQSFDEDCRKSGAAPQLSFAPTPLAAIAAARAGRALEITEPGHLIGQISSLPLLTLRWPQEVLDRLKHIGVYTIGAALRLPRAGFARRFGRAQLAELDRLTGRDADLRRRFSVSEKFQRKHDLLYEIEHHEAILNTLEPVLQELERFLESRQCGITRLVCLLKHRHAPATRCVLRLASPSSNARHLGKLLGERLSRVTLPEPVRSCELRSGSLISRAPEAGSLWRPGEHGGEGAHGTSSELIEHLRARLGHAAVYGLRVLESHRPEFSWSPAEISLPARTKYDETLQDRLPWAPHRRPLWLLPTPEALTERHGLPCRQGPLRVLEGPECVESGWWDHRDVTRDYYVAVDSHGVRLWIFRQRVSPRAWFLHGLFG
jgi:protein ImuB